MEVNCPTLTRNLENCVCTSEDCLRKGLCCDCIANHRANGNLPACLRPME